MSTTLAEPQITTYRLTAEDYFAMVDAGILRHDRRVELWGGILYEKMAKTLPHAVGFSNLVIVLARILPPGWCLWPENPITIASDKVPLPDLTIVRGVPNDYTRRGRRPEVADVGLVIEVAMTSVREDRGETLEGYARTLLPVYWIVNLRARRIEVYSRPCVRDGRGVYESAEMFGPDQSVPLAFDGVEVARIAVNDILPPM